MARMPRTRIHKTDRSSKDTSLYERAYDQIVTRHLSIRAAAKEYELSHVSLIRYKRKREAANTDHSKAIVSMGYNSCNRIFTKKQETLMADYIIKAAQMYNGCSPKEIRKLAYGLTKKIRCEETSSMG
ncbi:hypothetical protein NQ314_005954 [Rhamnusium bicolor]|uniref:HTH psq-type domain-containing protein n=1 Tax=Rhamnusium bicolor TaxID=1586634 RepID=A0AAV8ZB54_9CUCU|nr:hypothetical protein NQ314_005954 [Rhamnusium bicolor]